MYERGALACVVQNCFLASGRDICNVMQWYPQPNPSHQWYMNLWLSAEPNYCLVPLQLWPAMEKPTTRDFSFKLHLRNGSMQNLAELWPKNCTRVTCASVHNFSRNGAFCTYIAQRSMFPYTLRITPRGLRHNEFAGKDGHRESASTAVLVLGRKYREKRWTLHFMSGLWSFV